MIILILNAKSLDITIKLFSVQLIENVLDRPKLFPFYKK